MKTVGGDAFITYHILYHYFKNSQNKLPDCQKKQKPGGMISYLMPVCNLKTILSD